MDGYTQLSWIHYFQLHNINLHCLHFLQYNGERRCPCNFTPARSSSSATFQRDGGFLFLLSTSLFLFHARRRRRRTRIKLSVGVKKMRDENAFSAFSDALIVATTSGGERHPADELLRTWAASQAGSPSIRNEGRAYMLSLLREIIKRGSSEDV